MPGDTKNDEIQNSRAHSDGNPAAPRRHRAGRRTGAPTPRKKPAATATPGRQARRLDQKPSGHDARATAKSPRKRPRFQESSTGPPGSTAPVQPGAENPPRRSPAYGA